VSVPVIIFDDSEPQANLAYEEELFNNLRLEPAPVCLFYINDPCIVLGRSNVAETWVYLEEAHEDGVPVLRRFSGGGAVYHCHSVLNFSFIMPKSMLAGLVSQTEDAPGPARYIDFFRGIVISALERGGGGYSATGVSDVSLHGRKVSGNAQRIAANLVLHHGTLMLNCPLAQIERYLKPPPNRPGIMHRDFVTGLAEEGRGDKPEQLRHWLAAEFNSAIKGIAPESVSM
jgi:lipoate---protein ligase